MKVLLGYTGLVGSNLNHTYFDVLLNRSNLDSFLSRGEEVDELWIAAGDARKWYASTEPLLFEEESNLLTEKIILINPSKAILFSTIDVYDGESEVNEYVVPRPRHPYGRVQFQREIMLRKALKNLKIIRLPGLFGNKLRKNLIFDLLSGQKTFVESMNGNSTFQYFDLKLLHKLVFSLERDLTNLVTEPVSVLEIYSCYSKIFNNRYEFNGKGLVSYNVMTSQMDSGYFYSKDLVLQGLYEFFKENKR